MPPTLLPRAGSRACVLSPAALCAALALVTSSAARAACERPPTSLRACQDQYGSTGRVFLVWSNGESTYTGVRLYLDGAPAGEGPGEARLGYFDEVPPGRHTFSVEGLCGDTPTARASTELEVLTESPHTQPLEGLTCTFDPATGRLVAEWRAGTRPSLFIDVYLRRAGAPGLDYVATIAGDALRVRVDGARATDRLALQFFDAKCYGSELESCPGPECPAPVRVRVCQDLYGTSGRLFVTWVGAAADYSGFDVFLDGIKATSVGPLRSQVYLEDVSPGSHVVGVQGICSRGTEAPVEQAIEVLAASPHQSPVRNLHCERDPAAGTITATWLPGDVPSDFIDLYLRRPGRELLEFVGTIVGDSTRVRVNRAGATDELVLQFFDRDCHGSPLVSCGDAPGSRRFLRGDVNGSTTVDLTDSIAALQALFLGEYELLCEDAADANDDARLDIADPIFVLNWLFSGGPAPAPPGPEVCGEDPTADTLPPCLTSSCE